MRYCIALLNPWNVGAFERRRAAFPGEWTVIERREDLMLAAMQALQPRYIFLPHWSWRVPDDIVDAFECVCFHMTDVPYGRGGSPLQNLIVRGHADTKLSALRMVHELDAGPVYMKKPLSLAGSAREILTRAADLTMDMMSEIVAVEPEPKPQVGTPTVFERRRPEQSLLPRDGTVESLYDFIRMLDADGYPPAFIEWGDSRLELTDARLVDGRLSAAVSIARRVGP